MKQMFRLFSMGRNPAESFHRVDAGMDRLSRASDPYRIVVRDVGGSGHYAIHVTSGKLSGDTVVRRGDFLIKRRRGRTIIEHAK